MKITLELDSLSLHMRTIVAQSLDMPDVLDILSKDDLEYVREATKNNPNFTV